MTASLWIHELPQRARELEDACRQALLLSGNNHLLPLSESLGGSEEDSISLVFTGQYNAGKSTLISALTGRSDIIIDSDVATNEVRSYEWGDVVLVDTPGVQAGVVEHDELAESALRNSDLVVFVISIDLLDEAAAAHLRHVAFGLGKQWGMAIVINKAGTMDADPVIRRAAVARELGQAGLHLPVVITDARDHLDALGEGDPDLRAELLEQGNVEGLALALNSLVRRSGQESRLRRPFEKVIAVCADALELLAEEPGEVAARRVLNRERRLATASRRRLEYAFDDKFLQYRRAIIELGEQVADNVDATDGLEGEERNHAIKSADAEFRRYAEARTQELLEELAAAIKHEASVAAQELAELEANPSLDYLRSLDQTTHFTGSDKPAPQKLEDRTPGDYTSVLDSIGKGAGAFAAKWGVEGTKGLEGVSKTFGHKTVYSIGKKLGHNFKPWEAVKITKSVGDAARVVNKAMPFVAIGIEAFMAIKADIDEGKALQARQERRRRAVADSAAAAVEVESNVRAELDQAMGDFYGPLLNRIAKDQADLDAVVAVRNDARGSLALIVAQCREALAPLDSAEADSGSASMVTGPTPDIG